MRLGKVPLGAGIVLALGACGGPQGRGGAGADCFRDDDCEFGLVCAALGTSSERVCTDDVNALVEQYVPEGLPVPVAGGTTSGGAANGGGGSGGAPGTTSGGMAGGGVPAMAGAPSMAGAPGTAGTAGVATGGGPSSSGGAPAEMSAGTSG